jgi:hypothetical protein
MNQRVASLVVLLVISSSAAAFVPLPPSEAKPTKEEIALKVREFRDILPNSSDAYFEERVEEFKKLGSPIRLQTVLAELYIESKHDERVAILHVVKYIGVEYGRKALPKIAQDFAVAWPNHPNDMSFAAFYVLDKFMDLAWEKLPRHERERRDKRIELRRDDVPEPEAMPPRASRDGWTHTGAPGDWQAILQIVVAKKLHHYGKIGERIYPLPAKEDADWIRIIDDHAFVRLRGKSSGTDFIFSRDAKGEWSLLCVMGQWVS